MNIPRHEFLAGLWRELEELDVVALEKETIKQDATAAYMQCRAHRRDGRSTAFIVVDKGTEGYELYVESGGITNICDAHTIVDRAR